LASFVARELTPDYLLEFYGPEAIETKEYLAAVDRGQVNLELMSEANLRLTQLYASPLSDADKLAQKEALLQKLAAQVPFEAPPNNATLIGVQLYNEGQAEMEELRATCGTWQRFLGAVASLQTKHFGIEQSPQIGPALSALSRRGCVPFPKPRRPIWSKQVRQQRLRRPPHP
jgi:predicted aminopeptidase